MMKTGNSVSITRSRAEACRESVSRNRVFIFCRQCYGPDECEETLMTTSEVEALINMKKAEKAKTDAKGRMDQMMDYIKKLRACARQFLQKEAGYILEKGKLMDQIEEQRRKREDIEPQQFSKDGNEQHMQVNHLGPALLTILLLPLLLRAGGASRIVNVNSVAHHCGVVDPQDLNLKLKRNSFNYMAAYGASKLAHLMFLSVLSSKLPAHVEIDVIVVHPGIVGTNLLGVIASHYRNKSFWRFDAAEGLCESLAFLAILLVVLLGLDLSQASPSRRQ